MSQQTDTSDDRDDGLGVVDDADGPTRLESVVKLFLGTLAVVAFGYLLSLVPPFERPLPGTPITVEAALLGVLALVVFGLFVVIADELETVAAERLDGPGDVDEAAGGILKYLVVFLAFLAVYDPLARAVVPFLAETGNAWLFDAAYTVVALLLLALAAALVYTSLDPLAEMLTGYVESEE
ncbi:hypothetical protein [Halorarius halobius]|uniref:hypothetical protein n=1 Tax=Halorarius halobius TaxID=2962671 RepID=UPI0020CBAF06|nr:hypothetical protein [Halorarius halobius]